MLWCHGKGCAVVISPSAAEESSLLIAAQIPVWVVRRPERRARYARRVFGPRCEACRSRVIKDLRA